MTALRPTLDDFQTYCFSKTVCHVYSIMTAKKYPNLMVSVVTPGFVDTGMTAKFPGDKIPVESGTVSSRHCLFADLGGSGWFYGSDGVRSPFTKGRNPGDPAYDGN